MLLVTFRRHYQCATVY